ncbi:hypothetical protein [Pseudomonas sp. 37 R 15]|uniref:hypothetical protein n=1 Tax=Pseudomonas sp. 37 R 15 TaxID=1844104 RepID=UPI001111EE08|nr:hypothetical protein [Pseudomonas sp. 37 R 15]
MNGLPMHIGTALYPAATFSTPYDNHRINDRHIENGVFNPGYTEGKPPPNVRSTTVSGIRPKNIWKDFFQVSEGNCVTVSAIKAAMAKYGNHPEGIYKNIIRSDEGFDITMRDGVKVFLTHEELGQAMDSAGFAGKGKVLRHAIFLYAASAKRAQNENNDGRAKQSFEAAMRTLNDGEHPGEALTRLGLKNHMRRGTVEELKNGAIGTLADSVHSVAVVDAHIDLWSIKRVLAGSTWEKAPDVLVLD